MEDIEKLELIEKYLEGSLPDIQRTDVEQKIKSDPTFSKEVEWQRQAVAQLSDPGMRLFQQKLHDYRQEAKSGTEKKTAAVVQMRPRQRVLALAATLALLIAAVVWLMRPTVPTTEDVFAAHYRLPALDVLSQGQGERGNEGTTGQPETATEKTMGEALNAYAQKDFPKALALLATIDEAGLTSEERSAYLFQKAIYHLANGDYDMAYSLLNREDVGNPSHREWYRALVMLKQNRPKTELITAFGAIANSKVNITYRERAASVLAAIEKLE